MRERIHSSLLGRVPYRERCAARFSRQGWRIGGFILGRISSGSIGESVLGREGTLEASILLSEVHEKFLSKKEASLEVFSPWEQE